MIVRALMFVPVLAALACEFEERPVNPDDACAGRLDGTVLCDSEPAPFTCKQGDKTAYVEPADAQVSCSCSDEVGIRPARCVAK